MAARMLVLGTDHTAEAGPDPVHELQEAVAPGNASSDVVARVVDLVVSVARRRVAARGRVAAARHVVVAGAGADANLDVVQHGAAGRRQNPARHRRADRLPENESAECKSEQTSAKSRSNRTANNAH